MTSNNAENAQLFLLYIYSKKKWDTDNMGPIAPLKTDDFRQFL